MLGNVALDLAIGALPVVGWLGDVFYRSNERNMALLRAHLERRGAAPPPPGRWPMLLAAPGVAAEAAS
jgi:hypothetical protein